MQSSSADVRSRDAIRFQGATLEEAVATARAALGPRARVIEANRIRRGGIGGFFATDLGVEITVVTDDGTVEDVLDRLVAQSAGGDSLEASAPGLVLQGGGAVAEPNPSAIAAAGGTAATASGRASGFAGVLARELFSRPTRADGPATAAAPAPVAPPVTSPTVEAVVGAAEPTVVPATGEPIARPAFESVAAEALAAVAEPLYERVSEPVVEPVEVPYTPSRTLREPVSMTPSESCDVQPIRILETPDIGPAPHEAEPAAQVVRELPPIDDDVTFTAEDILAELEMLRAEALTAENADPLAPAPMMRPISATTSVISPPMPTAPIAPVSRPQGPRRHSAVRRRPKPAPMPGEDMPAAVAEPMIEATPPQQPMTDVQPAEPFDATAQFVEAIVEAATGLGSPRAFESATEEQTDDDATRRLVERLAGVAPAETTKTKQPPSVRAFRQDSEDAERNIVPQAAEPARTARKRPARNHVDLAVEAADDLVRRVAGSIDGAPQITVKVVVSTSDGNHVEAEAQLGGQ